MRVSMEQKHERRTARGTIEAPPFRMVVLDRALKRYPVVLIVVFTVLFILFTRLLLAPSDISMPATIFGAIFMAGADQARFLWRQTGRQIAGPLASRFAIVQAASGILTMVSIALVGAADGGFPDALPALFMVASIFSVLYFAVARAGISLGVWSTRI